MKDEEIVELFFDVSRLNHQYSKMQPQNTDPFHGQHRCLSVLDTAGIVNQKNLAQALSIRPASVSEILTRMEQKGWILRRPSDKDKRVTLVSLTEEGRTQADQLRKDRARYHSNMLSGLTTDEKEQFSAALQKIKTYYISIMEGTKHYESHTDSDR